MWRPCNPTVLGIPMCQYGALTQRTRCEVHEREYQQRELARRGTAAQRGYDAAWRRLRRTILERDGYRCVWCGSPATQVDHLTPKAHGGTDDPANLGASCGSCNSARGGMTRRPA